MNLTSNKVKISSVLRVAAEQRLGNTLSLRRLPVVRRPVVKVDPFFKVYYIVQGPHFIFEFGECTIQTQLCIILLIS